MGFMDKVKSAGKSALKGALIMAAHDYGHVYSGKHKMCKICMNSTYDKLTFVKVTEIVEEVVIKEGLKTFCVTDKSDSFPKIRLVFNDGETSEVMLKVDEKQGSGLSSAADRVAAHYETIADLIQALATALPVDSETLDWANLIMRYTKRKEIKKM